MTSFFILSEWIGWELRVWTVKAAMNRRTPKVPRGQVGGEWRH